MIIYWDKRFYPIKIGKNSRWKLTEYYTLLFNQYKSDISMRLNYSFSTRLSITNLDHFDHNLDSKYISLFFYLMAKMFLLIIEIAYFI